MHRQRPIDVVARLAWTACLLVAIMASGAPAQPCADYRENLRVCGTTDLGFPATVVAMNGRTAYVAGADRLAAWDLSDPDAPRFLDDVALGVPALDIVAAGAAVCVRDESRVAVCDASDPANLGAPVVLGPFFDLLDIATNGNLLLVVREYTGLEIYDLADLGAIQLVGQVASEYARAVALRGSIALLADVFLLRIIDLADPAAPVVLANYNQPATPDGNSPFFVDVVPTRTGAAVRMSEASGLPFRREYTVSLDLSDPAQPRQVAYGAGATFDGALDDMLLRWQTGNLEVWRCAPDVGIQQNAAVPFPGADGMMAGADGVECGVNGDGQMLVIDARYPGFVMPLAPLAGRPVAPGLMISSTYDCGSGCDMVYRLYDVADPFAPVQRDEVRGSVYGCGATLLGIWGDRLAWEFWDGTNTSSRLFDFSVSPPAFARFWEMTVLDVAGQRAFVSQHSGPVRVYDLTSFSTPTLLGMLPANGLALALTADVVLLPDGTAGIKVVDCTVPSTPQVLTTLALGGAPSWWRRVEDLVFVAAGNSRFAVLNVEDPRAPAIAYLGAVPGAPSDVVIQGNLAAIAMRSAGVRIYDLAGAAGIVPVGSLLAAPVAGGPVLAWVDNVLYAAAGNRGLQAFDVSDPANAVYLGAGNGAGSVVAGPGVLLIPGGVMPLQCADSVEVIGDPDTPPPAAVSSPLIAVPNPFNPRTTLRFRLEREGDADLAVYDLLGHRVRQLRQGRLAAGDHAVVWDGCDDAGCLQAAGVYLARLSTEDAVSRARLVLIK